ncbi:MAG: hypothetical protein KDB19_06130, partial [Microthrixaceae bacterium]|nr:hypothetical protein [Microthrixaceae bacterium]
MPSVTTLSDPAHHHSHHIPGPEHGSADHRTAQHAATPHGSADHRTSQHRTPEHCSTQHRTTIDGCTRSSPGSS